AGPPPVRVLAAGEQDELADDQDRGQRAREVEEEQPGVAERGVPERGLLPLRRLKRRHGEPVDGELDGRQQEEQVRKRQGAAQAHRSRERRANLKNLASISGCVKEWALPICWCYMDIHVGYRHGPGRTTEPLGLVGGGHGALRDARGVDRRGADGRRGRARQGASRGAGRRRRASGAVCVATSWAWETRMS